MSLSKNLADFLSANRSSTFFIPADEIRMMMEKSKGYYQEEVGGESTFCLVRRTPKRGDNLIEIRKGILVQFLCQLVEETHSYQWEPARYSAWVPRIMRDEESRFSFDLTQERRLLDDLRVFSVGQNFPERIVKGPWMRLTQLHQGIQAELRLLAATYCFESEYSFLKRELEEKLDRQDLARGNVRIVWSPDPLPEDHLLKMNLKAIDTSSLP